MIKHGMTKCRFRGRGNIEGLGQKKQAVLVAVLVTVALVVAAVGGPEAWFASPCCRSEAATCRRTWMDQPGLSTATASNLLTSATLVVTSAVLVVTRCY